MNIIRSAADLAINGAPAFFEPLHVGRADIGNRDAFLALAGDILDNRWLTNKRADGAGFRHQLADDLWAKQRQDLAMRVEQVWKARFMPAP